MSDGLEQAVEDATGEQVDNEAEQNTDQETNQEVESPEVSPDVEKAMSGGWRPKDEWKGDADDWVSAKRFNQTGELMESVSSLRKRVDRQSEDFDKRTARQVKLHEAQTKHAIDNLIEKRDNAVDMADRDAVNKIQGQIDELGTQPEEVAPAKDTQDLDNWNIANPWINEETPKSAYAFQQYGKYCKAGNSDIESIRLMEADISKEFPAINSRRENAPTVEGGRSNPGKRVERKLAWNELTREEVNIFTSMAGTWTKDEYIQAVADDRKARKG